VAAENVTLPSSGPLADGVFTLDDLRAVLFRTASPTPQADRASGDECEVATLAPTVPVPWSTVPEGPHRWAFVGYGSVEEHSLARALEVLDGTRALPDRATEDSFYALDQEARAAYHGVP
jgi:hypothetical protein